MAFKTKSEQVEKTIRDAILKGKWGPGEALPSEREFLQQFGVSRTTLRNALYCLANDGLVTRKHGVGTCVADTTKTGVVAILARTTQLCSSQGHYYRALLEELQSLICGAGYRAVLFIGHGDTLDEFASSTKLFDDDVLKEVLCLVSFTDIGSIASKTEELGLDAIFLRGGIDPVGRYSIVNDLYRMIDYIKAMLHDHGRSSFDLMYIDWRADPLYELSRDCYEVHRELALSLVDGDESRIAWVPWSPNYENSYETFKTWWAKPDHPDTMVFLEDSVFDFASRAILELGISVPQDLGIVTHANSTSRLHFPVPVCGVGFDPAEMANAAWGMVKSIVTGERVARPIVYMPPMVQNGETL